MFSEFIDKKEIIKIWMFMPTKLPYSFCNINLTMTYLHVCDGCVCVSCSGPEVEKKP